MDMLILEGNEKGQYEWELRTLCQNSDKEFVPPLSQRSSTTQASMAARMDHGIDGYFREMMGQNVLVCVDAGKVLGFVSYRENYRPEHYPHAQYDNLYISTLILAPESRGRGLTKALYRYLFYEAYPRHHIYTRTWSENIAHIRILSQFGFQEILRLKDHRGPGVDTVYFGLER